MYYVSPPPLTLNIFAVISIIGINVMKIKVVENITMFCFTTKLKLKKAKFQGRFFNSVVSFDDIR